MSRSSSLKLVQSIPSFPNTGQQYDNFVNHHSQRASKKFAFLRVLNRSLYPNGMKFVFILGTQFSRAMELLSINATQIYAKFFKTSSSKAADLVELYMCLFVLPYHVPLDMTRYTTMLACAHDKASTSI